MYVRLFTFMTIIGFIILIKNQPRDRRTIFEPGVLILGLFSLCYLAPTLAIVFGTDILPLNDNANVEILSLYGLLFVVSFTFFYLGIFSLIPKKLASNNIKYKYWSPRSCLILILVLHTITKLISFSFGIGTSGNYADQYLIRLSMPVAVSQMLNLFGGIEMLLVCLLLCTTLAPSEKRRTLRYLWIIALVFFVDMLLTQARSNFVTFCLLFAGTYNFYRRPIGVLRETLISLFFIMIMSVFSIIRAGGFGGGVTGLIGVLLPSEFIGIYANALHLVTLAGSNNLIAPPGSSYLQSLIAFIPQQINVDKWSLSLWYVSTYFPDYKEAGGGLAFGIIPEAIVNFGLISIVFQALIIVLSIRIPYLLARRRYYSGINIWILFYLYCFTLIYQMIRSHSFVVFESLFIGFLIPYLIIFTLGRSKVIRVNN